MSNGGIAEPLGCRPNRLLNSNSRSIPWVATQTGLRGGQSPPLRTPGSFNCALSLNRDGRVPVTTAIAAKCRRSGGSLTAGFYPRKKRAVLHLLFGAIFECGPEFFKDKNRPCFDFDFDFKERRPCSKCHRQVGRETTSLPLARTRSRESRSDDILRR